MYKIWIFPHSKKDKINITLILQFTCSHVDIFQHSPGKFHSDLSLESSPKCQSPSTVCGETVQDFYIWNPISPKYLLQLFLQV